MTTPTLPNNVSQHLLGLRHVGVVTEDSAAMITRLQGIFGLVDDEIIRVPPQDAEFAEPVETRFAFFSIGGVPFEVIEPVSEHFKNILLKTNLGVNHLCYNVDDLPAAVAAMADAGVRLGHVTPTGIVDLPSFRMAYFNPEDTAGLLIEFVEPRS